MRVLVVEDDRKVAQFIQSGLAEESYGVDVLHEGDGAGEQAQAVDYDAVVLDLMLPGRSGLQVLRDVRARRPMLPVLILTAKDSLEERVAGLAELTRGLQGYLRIDAGAPSFAFDARDADQQAFIEEATRYYQVLPLTLLVSAVGVWWIAAIAVAPLSRFAGLRARLTSRASPAGCRCAAPKTRLTRWRARSMPRLRASSMPSTRCASSAPRLLTSCARLSPHCGERSS